MGKLPRNKKPLIVKEVKFASADNPACRKRIEEVYKLLLAPGKAEKQERRT